MPVLCDFVWWCMVVSGGGQWCVMCAMVWAGVRQFVRVVVVVVVVVMLVFSGDRSS